MSGAKGVDASGVHLASLRKLSAGGLDACNINCVPARVYAPDDPLFVHDESGSPSHTSLLVQDSIQFTDLVVGEITEKGKLNPELLGIHFL